MYGNVFERNWYIQDQAANGTLLSTNTNFLRKFNVFGVMPQHRFKFSLFGLDQQITSGVRYHAERLTDITGIGTAGSKISRTTNNADLESVAYAAYTETAIRLTEALTISPGIRWEQVNQSRETMNAVPPAEELRLQNDARPDLRDRGEVSTHPGQHAIRPCPYDLPTSTFANAVRSKRDHARPLRRTR
ncbi:MAG: TonB-dependent receptor [Nitrospira sp.]|nr:TonB-dependent receptor [Nitrospira sp.]